MNSLTLEYKFRASFKLKEVALSILNHSCYKDPKYTYGVVNSIYFDSLDNQSYYEKINGDFLKSKVRIRWYEQDPCKNSITVYIEIKKKIGQARDKLRYHISLPVSQFKKYLKNDDSLRSLLEEVLKANQIFFKSNLYPVVRIQYQRNRFVCPFTQSRLSLDSNIKGQAISNLDYFNKFEVFLPDLIFEVKQQKYQDMIWLNLLYQIGFRRQNFSKFGTCLNYLKGLE